MTYEHLLQGRVPLEVPDPGLLLEWQHVLGRLVHQARHAAPRRQFPQHQAARVHVDSEEGVAREVDGTLEHLRRHVAAGANLKQLLGIGHALLESQSRHPDVQSFL